MKNEIEKYRAWMHRRWRTKLACLFVISCTLLVLYINSAVIGAYLSNTNAPAWVQAIGSVVAILAAIGIAGWQAKKDRQLKRESEIAAAEVVGSSVAQTVTYIASYLTSLRDATNARNLGNGFDAPNFRNKIKSLVLPTETQLLYLAPVINDGAIALARGSSIVTQIQSQLASISELNGFYEIVFKDAQIQSLERMVELAIKEISAAQGALIDLLAARKLPTGRQIIQR